MKGLDDLLKQAQKLQEKVQDAQQHYRDALDELTQLSQDMGMYPAIDEHGHQDLT